MSIFTVICFPLCLCSLFLFFPCLVVTARRSVRRAATSQSLTKPRSLRLLVERATRSGLQLEVDRMLIVVGQNILLALHPDIRIAVANRGPGSERHSIVVNPGPFADRAPHLLALLVGSCDPIQHITRGHNEGQGRSNI